MTWRIPLSDIDFGPEEEAAVGAVVRGRWLTMGAITQEFEAEAAAFTGAKHAIALTNATAALHLACLAAGLGLGDEVILPALTFVASANAVRYTGATPVFADIAGEHDLNLSVRAAEAALTERTRAVMVVHYGGYPCDMPAFMELAERYNLAIIEDAAHAIGSELEGRHLGLWGQSGCYSFFSNKNMTTGEGGMLVTNDDTVAEKIRTLRSHGMTSLTWDRHKGHAWSYDVTGLGYNYRIDELRSALGRVQLGKLARNNQLRRELSACYWELLQELCPALGLPFRDHAGLSACHLLPVLLPEGVSREAFMEAMKRHGIQTSIHYPPIHHFSAYNASSSRRRTLTGHFPRRRSLPELPHTESIAAREVTLPLYPSLSEADVLAVAEAARDALGEV